MGGSGTRRGRAAIGVAAIAATMLPASAAAQTIRGVLVERATYALIDLGTAYLISESGDTVAAALSDENGVLHLTAPEPGRYRVVAHALGYLPGGAGPFELEEDGLRVIQLALVPAPLEIEGVDVRTSRIVVSDDYLLANGFYERMLEGRGQFLTPEEIESSDARFTPFLFRGLEYVRPQYGAAPWLTWVRLWNPIGAGACGPRVWVDDVWINKPGFELYAEGLGLEDVVPKETIKAVELYWGMQSPLKYSAADGLAGPGLCGAVVIWTKTGRAR